MDSNRRLFFWTFSGSTKRLIMNLRMKNQRNDRLVKDLVLIMREYIDTNLTVIKNYLKKRKKIISKLNSDSIMEEFKEWVKDPIPETESIWTLPDLTRNERLNNFCRSIKKEIR